MQVLVAVDFADSSPRLIDEATRLVNALGGKVWILHVADPDPDFIGYEAGPQSVRDAVAERFHEEHKQIQQWAEGLRSGGRDCTSLLVQGPTVDTILQQADKVGADIIVVGSHGKGLARQLLLGSTSSGVIRKSTVPVLVLPAAAAGPAT